MFIVPRYGAVFPSASLRLVPASGSLVAETRRQAEIVKATLRALPLDATTAGLVNNVLAGSQCLNSVDEAIAAIDAGVSAIVVSESDIELLSSQVRSLQGQKKASGLMLSAADVVETLGSVLPKLSAPATQGEICGTGTEATFQELWELARIISNAATLPGAQFSSHELSKTGSTLYAVVGFLKDVSQTYAGLSNTCATDPTRGKSSALALGSTLEDLADLLGVLGSYTEAEKTRQGAEQVKAALEAFESLDGLDLWETDCGSANLEGAAANMRQLAGVLEDQGLLQISQELGIDLDLLPLGIEF